MNYKPRKRPVKGSLADTIKFRIGIDTLEILRKKAHNKGMRLTPYLREIAEKAAEVK